MPFGVVSWVGLCMGVLDFGGDRQRGRDSLGVNRERERESKVLPEPYGPLGSADLCSIGPQPDTSLHCKDRGYGASALRGVSVYSPAVRPVPNYTAW